MFVKTQTHTSAVRSRISSNLLFASCVGFCDRAFYFISPNPESYYIFFYHLNNRLTFLLFSSDVCFFCPFRCCCRGDGSEASNDMYEEEEGDWYSEGEWHNAGRETSSGCANGLFVRLLDCCISHAAPLRPVSDQWFHCFSLTFVSSHVLPLLILPPIFVDFFLATEQTFVYCSYG